MAGKAMCHCRIIDADCHVMEPDAIWADYLEAPFNSRSPRRQLKAGLEWGQVLLDDEPIYRHYPPELAKAFQDNIESWYGPYLQKNFDAPSLLEAMKKSNIEQSHLYPSLTLGMIAVEGQDPAMAAAITRAYNNWLFDYCSADRSRLRPVALISLHDVDAAVAEIERVSSGLGIKTVVIRPNPIGGRPIGLENFWPFWRACAEREVSVAIHEGCHARLPAAGSDRFTTHFAMHTCCHPMEQMMAFVTLVENGVFEAFPTLQVAFLEAGCGWVPFLLSRIDNEYRLWGSQVPAVKRRPSEYFRRQCYVSVEGCEPHVDSVIECVGVERLLFGSDYPHPDHAFGEEVSEILAAPLSSDAKQKILFENPRRFYGEGL